MKLRSSQKKIRSQILNNPMTNDKIKKTNKFFKIIQRKTQGN